MQFIDLFAGLGGFGVALTSLGHDCVFASELDPNLRTLYSRNHSIDRTKVFGDIHGAIDAVPRHDILCAGFPCQPFSKSGYQRGLDDETSGTAFGAIRAILERHRPRFVFLENVGNFERHDSGRTWEVVRASLVHLGYHVWATEHKTTGGNGLLSPMQVGIPHLRERFFILADLDGPVTPIDLTDSSRTATPLESILKSSHELTPTERNETMLSETHQLSLRLWQEFISRLPSDGALPSFPLWSDEFGASYPFRELTPYWASYPRLHLLPTYAQTRIRRFPSWKVNFIAQNRSWYRQYKDHIDRRWLKAIRGLPSSYRKLEWNVKGQRRELAHHVLQFRPSGVRVRRGDAIPALVAMTPSQLPVVGSRWRFISRSEAAALQSFPPTFDLPEKHDDVFRALGNAVNVSLVRAIAGQFLSDKSDHVNIHKSTHLSLKGSPEKCKSRLAELAI